jgi:hypothetical protein
MGIDPLIQQQVIDGLKLLGEKLGAGAQHFWPVLIRQKVLDGIECLLGAVLLSPSFLFVRRMWNAACEADDREYECGCRVAAIVAIFLIGISTFVLLINGADLLLNPEYWALKSLTDMLIKK